ncbi:MAG: DUF3320 domain-containing protein [Methanobrevibacter sp.]|nr:DUF3320 domain-containing protein [Methanobrevibacter sp.]
MLSNSSTAKIEKEFKNLRKELLDLTLRNQLLNFKSRAKTISIKHQTPINVYQTLVLQENKMYFVANKKDKKEDKSSVWDHIPFDFSKFQEGNKKLATDLTPNELQKRLYYINNQAKTMLQEQGYNILYLAVGFLEWKDKSKPRQVNHAPLVLIPVSMERKKVGESFNLEWTGEDIQTNISLKAKLLDAGIELPDFEFKKYGEVIDHYIAKVKRAVSKMEDWEVNNNIALGFFSFTKFVMYNDLNPEAWADNVDLTKNELIQAIFNPAKNDVEAFNEEDIDSQLDYQSMYQVLDADSSQIAAIQDVKAGRNLVVEGPPGTGKSQTIVNLIAELLAEGKSVLFVSEKMAALDVVKDRLTNVGLGKFVLELHSHKTRRKKFLKDLEKSTTVRAVDTLNIDQTIRKLETLKHQLDDYASVIHRPVFAVNYSAFQLYGMKESADDHFSRKNTIMPLVRFDSPQTVTLKELDDVILGLESVAELYQTISKENPWSKCSPKSLLPADLREIEMLINDTLTSLDAFLVERGRVYDIYGIKKPDTLNEFEKSLSAFDIIKTQNSELIDSKILKSGAWEKNNDDAYLLIQELAKYQRVAPILDKFNPNIYQTNIDRLIYELDELSHKKLRFFKNKQHLELVERYYNYPVHDDIQTIIDDLNQAKIAIRLKKSLEANEQLAKQYYGDYWHLNADINDLKSIARWMTQFTSLTKEGIFSQNTIDILSKDLFDINPERDLVDYIDSGKRFSSDLEKLKSKLNPRSKLIFKKGANDVAFEDWQSQLYNWRGQLSSLHLWSQYLNTKNSLKGTTAELFIDSIEKRNIKKDDIKALVEGNFADSLLNILFVENHELATFIGELHENRIKEFKDLDRKILVLNRKRIFHKLNSNIPQIFGATENPQAKVLAGEFTRKSGHLPVRKLLEKAGGMIKQIKPCFMMSPLSVAQYLDPTNEELQFDVVIFDEASQVKPEDALGAFMRGKTAVVMGDTQQLPPTSFFDQMASGESDEEEATSLDMESILHLCKLSFPVKMLKWHYRSRHESLISVSNKEFYDNELLVYPSPSHNDPELGLKFHYNPNTAYDRGSSSANPKEAEDVVEAIFDHFDRYGDTKSLGVGTFSVAQKNAILEKLEEKRRERPELEPLFSENKDERFFVKNLETIQGDERDVILISVGYGFDNERKMSLNFGPLNQDGGERRLNVLITRARQKCVVFSNFKASSMKLTANPPHGVRALREFLEYAENLTIGAHTTEEHSQAPFEDAIASFLEENGYQVDRQIGCAGFRVDLAIVDEENPGKYILGITTDGKMYASSKVARDRDRLREQVLEGLGWKLYHLWSTDWYRNRDLGRKKLLDFIEKSIKQTRKEQEIARKEEEKRKIEAEKRAKELRKKRERELEKQRKREAEAEAASLGENVEVIPPDGLDFDDDIVFVSQDGDEDFNDEGVEFVEEESPSEFVEVSEDATEDVEVESPSQFTEITDDSSAFDDFIFKDDGEVSTDEKTVNEEVTDEDTLEDETIEKEINLKDESEDVTTPDIELDGEDSLNEDLDEVNVDDILDELSDNEEDVSDDEEEVGGESSEDTFTSDKDDSEDVPYKNEEVTEENEEEVDEEGSATHKIKFGSTISKATGGSILSSIKDKFSKSKPEDEIDESIDINDKLDEDDFIYVDHTNDEESIVDYDDVEDDLDSESVDDEHVVVDEDIPDDLGDGGSIEDEDIPDDLGDEEPIVEEIKEKPKVKFNKSTDNINLEDMGNTPIEEDIPEDEIDLGSEENMEESVEREEIFKDDEKIDLDFDDTKEVDESIGNEKIDLGSDDDYIYVDHTNDEESIIDYSDDELPEIEVNPLKNIFGGSKPKNQNGINESRFAEAIKGTSKLNLTKEEVKTVHGEIIDEDVAEPEYIPKDDDVVEVEIITDNSKEESFENDDFNNEEIVDIPPKKNNKVKFKRNIDGVSEMKGNKPIKEKDFNRIIDETFMNNPEGTLGEEDISNLASALVSKAFDDVISDAFNEKEDVNTQNYNDDYKDYQGDNENNGIDLENEYKTRPKSTPDGVTYYEGVSDIQSPLKKNNLYYEEDKNKNKSVKDSIKSGIRDIKYIRKSLNEIENPTPVGYVSVVDRTEEYDVNDYVEPIQDYEGEEYVPQDEGLTFAEKEEQRYERELKMEQLKRELSSDDNTIVTIHEQERREVKKDQALEDIIQIADEDYKEIEKERFRNNNTLKAFDDNKLPKRGKIEDEIFEYKFASDFGLNSQKDLFDQPIENVSKSITEIVNVEGPIHVNEVVKRVKDSCNIKRAGSKMKKQVTKAIKESENSGNIIRIGDFLYDASSNDVVIRKRVKPNIDLISDEEIAKNIETILLHKQMLPTANLIREVSRNFGFKSTSRKTSAKIKIVLDSMIAEGSVKLDKDIVELN